MAETSKEAAARMVVTSLIGLVFAHGRGWDDYAACLQEAEKFLNAVRDKYGVDLIAELSKEAP